VDELLEAERARALERREEQRLGVQLDSRARMCRRELLATRRDSGPMVRRPPSTLQEAADQLYDYLPEGERAAIVARAEELGKQHGGRRVAPLTTQQTKDIAKAYLAEHRTATSGQVYDHVVKQGQPSMQRQSFQSAVMPALRKELGITDEERPGPSTLGGAPRKKVAGAKKRPASEAPPPPRTALPAPTPEGVLAAAENGQPAPVREERAEVEPGDFADGDRILVEVAGERLDARRAGGRWSVKFDGSLDDVSMARLLGRVVAGVGR